MIEELEKISVDEVLEHGEEVEAAIPPRGERMSVLSIRIDPETLRALELHAKGIGEKPTSVAREFIRQGLAGNGTDLSLEELLQMMMTRLNRERRGNTGSPNQHGQA